MFQLHNIVKYQHTNILLNIILLSIVFSEFFTIILSFQQLRFAIMTNNTLPIAKLLKLYSTQQHLANYTDKQQLLSQLVDFKTLLNFAQSQFIPKFKALRKQTTENLQAINAFNKRVGSNLNIFVQQDIPHQLISQANEKLAYDILAKSTYTKEQLTVKQQHELMQFEMKLKFMEADGLQIVYWRKWFNPHKKMLVLKDHNQFNINVILSYQNEKYIWQVQEVQYMHHYHHILTDYYQRILMPKFRQNDPDDKKVLKLLYDSLKYCKSLFIFQKFKKQCETNPRINTEIKVGKFTMKIQSVNYQLIFPDMDKQNDPALSIVKINTEDQTQQAQPIMFFVNNKATMKICNKILTTNIKSKFNRDYVIFLLENYHVYQKKLDFILTSYQTIKIQGKLHLIIKHEGDYWEEENYQYQQEQVYKQIVDNGIYLVYEGEWSPIIIRILENINFFHQHALSEEIQNCLTMYNYELQQLFAHLQLCKYIVEDNLEYQYKLSKIQIDSTDVFYQFLQAKNFLLVEKKIFLSSAKSNDRQFRKQRIVVKVIINKGFTEIKLEDTKPSSARPGGTTTTAVTYGSQQWNNYLKQKSPSEKLNITKVATHIRYVLKHLMSFLFLNEDVNQKDRSNVVYDFKS